jgi:glycosyltransferase involved in cell wall biosynthesis
MARILMVSKAVTPPWNDSSKNLVRDLAVSLRVHRATVMTHARAQLALPGVAHANVYGARPSRFAPALLDNARAMLHLLTGRGYDLWHFFFAPNPKSSRACALAARARRVPTVQTLCSAPAAGANLRALLFADRTVVLSRHTQERALEAGVPQAALRLIPPAVAPLQPLSSGAVQEARVTLGLPLDQLVLVYPGDLEFSSGAERALRAHALLRQRHDCVLALACRMKTPHARAHEERLRALTKSLRVDGSVFWLGETRQIHDLLGAADVVVLPSESLYAKMDLPLVLIEAMLLARPVVVAEQTPAAELGEGGAAVVANPEPDSLAHSIEVLLKDSNARTALGVRARSFALERFDPISVASQYENLYDELLR